MSAIEERAAVQSQRDDLDELLAAQRRSFIADGPPDVALSAGVIDTAYGVTFRHITVDGVLQPVAWERQE